MSYFGSTDFYLEVVRGTKTGITTVNKFGNAPDFDTGDNAVDVWDGADDGGLNGMVYTYSATANIDGISSSDNTDTQDVEIQGLDTNYALVTQTVTLTGQTTATLSTALIRVFRIKNSGSTDFGGVVDRYINGATVVSGVPSTASEVRALVQVGNNQTEMAIYTVPDGKTAYLRHLYAATQGASKATNYTVSLFVRPFGGVFQLKHRRTISDDKDLVRDFEIPEVIAAKSDVVVRSQINAVGVTAGSTIAGFDLLLIE